MKKLSMLFQKTVLVALVAAMALAALPVASAYASGLDEPLTPPSEGKQFSNERIEQAWARMQEIYERQGQRLERADQMTERFQTILDRMSEKGKDVTALQAALDAFGESLKDAHPLHESSKGIINAHKGFDADGKVTDREQAIETLKELRGDLQEVRALVGEPGKALREAIKAFREANRPAETSGAAE